MKINQILLRLLKIKIKVKIKIIVGLALLLLIRQGNCGQIDNGVGFGVQYGGVLGYQLSYTQSQSKYRASVGLIGASLGYDYYLSDTFSMGATYTISGRNVSSLNINYVPSGYTNNGWIFGIDLARIDGQSAGGSSFFLRKEKKSKNIIFFSAGYKF